MRGIALVGSHARGNAQPESDIDLVLLCADPERYLTDVHWLSDFGEPTAVSREDWGKVQALRVFYRTGPEVEFGLTTPDWAAFPADPGTASVVANGVSVLLDRDGSLLRLAQFIRALG